MYQREITERKTESIQILKKQEGRKAGKEVAIRKEHTRSACPRAQIQT